MPGILEELRTKSLFSLWTWVFAGLLLFSIICILSRWRCTQDLYPAKLVHTALNLIQKANSIFKQQATGSTRIQNLLQAQVNLKTAQTLLPVEVLAAQGVDVKKHIYALELQITKELSVPKKSIKIT